jgi:hypothetical protein
VLLLTNRVNWEGKLMPGKAFSREDLRQMLAAIDLPQVEFRPWQVYYELIWARKAGMPSRLGRGTTLLEDLLRCPHCGGPLHIHESEHIHCPLCSRRYPIRDGIYDLERGRPTSS